MQSEVRMPDLGTATEQGRVERWLVAEGGVVERGQPLLEVSIGGAGAVIEASASGTLARILAVPGAVLPVGALLGIIREASQATSPAGIAPRESGQTGEGRHQGSDVHVGGLELSASPAARRLARELGIDIAQVPPSAPGRRVTSEDVERFAVRLTPAGDKGPLARARPAVTPPGQGHLSAQVTLAREIDVGGLIEHHRRLAPGLEVAGIRLTTTDLLLEAVARLLPERPQLNQGPVGDAPVGGAIVHLGVMVTCERGPVVLVIRNAHARSLAEIARERAELTVRARAGRLGREETEGATFLLVDLGDHDVDVATIALPSSTCAVLSVGRIAERPAVVGGEVRPRPLAWLALSFDRRLADEGSAAAFLHALAGRLAG